MKTLLLVRHAKSSWGDFTLPDFDRPLNERGKKDAPEMAKRLLARKISIDAFVSSPAKRAKKTCKLFCREFNEQEDKIIYVDRLYLAPAHAFFDVVKSLNNKFKTVAVFAHNPGITEFANSLCGEAAVDDMPTCAVFAIEIRTDDWAGLESAEKKFLFFDHPKNND